MELRDLEAFEHLASSLHFGRTARALGMSPSALTRRIQTIEEELAHPLLLRDQRTVELTRAGEMFREFARGELSRYRDLVADLDRETRSPSGELRIACTVTACYSILPTLLARARARFPRIIVRLVTQDADRSLEELRRGEVDLAVIPRDVGESSDLEECPLGETRLVFVGPERLESLGVPELTKRLMSQAADLRDVPIVAPLAGLERKRLDGYFAARSFTPNIVAEVRGNEGVLAMVSLGSGISLVPELVLDASPLGRTLTRLSALEAPPGYLVSLCARPKSLRRGVVQAFFELARSERCEDPSGAVR